MIIAGGGPAGPIAARRAEKNGLSVLVLEKAAYPKDKTCGGGVSQKVLDAIEGINKGLIERKIFGTKVSLPARLQEHHRLFLIFSIDSLAAFRASSFLSCRT